MGRIGEGAERRDSRTAGEIFRAFNCPVGCILCGGRMEMLIASYMYLYKSLLSFSRLLF